MATLCCRLGHAGVPAGHAEELRKDLEAKLKQLKAIDDYVQGQMSRQASVLRSGACLAPGLACTAKGEHNAAGKGVEGALSLLATSPCRRERDGVAGRSPLPAGRSEAACGRHDARVPGAPPV